VRYVSDKGTSFFFFSAGRKEGHFGENGLIEV
jgi:hypothetical protein